MTDDPIKLFVVVMAILLCVLGFVSYASYGPAAAFEKVIRYNDRFRGESRFSSWIHRIVVNEALMVLRDQRRRRSERVVGVMATTVAATDGRVSP